MDSLERAANPKYIELLQQSKENGEKLDTLVVNSEHSLLMFDRLCTLKEQQQENDNIWREKWLESKRSSTRFTLTQIAIGCAALYFGVIDINKDSEFVKDIISGVGYLMGLFV